jgi:D-beta-D-heptose 7-phosphate kinase/D-beta-D-heptose 1-phosphate adenosyltransferase
MVILNKIQAKQVINKWKDDNKSIVFTNGCFDIIHRGHIEYLKQTKELGDYLIVGLNSDKSVERLKGKPRPYQTESDRAEILNSLRFVDIVIIFEEDTPLKLICELKPDILVKGGDYDLNTVVGAKEMHNWGGEVKIIPFLKGYGTSKLIEKIVNN